MESTLRSDEVKEQARGLGADLVGIIDCHTLNTHPPDPTAPQTPHRISERFRSCIVLAKRMPLGEFLSNHRWLIAHNNQTVMRALEKTAYRLAHWLDSQGYYSLQVATDETDPELKRGSYGYLSMRHLAVEAGLGTFGLESNLLTREYGPRVYLTALLTEAQLTPGQRILEQLCIGETCGRCMLACPTDAVHQWALDKRLCALAAQVHGISSILYGPLKRIVEQPEHAQAILAERNTRDKWQSMIRLVEAFGVCPRCIEVCPIGTDYKRYLAREHRDIPELTPAKKQRLQAMKGAARSGGIMQGNPTINVRYIGPNGYHPPKREKAVSSLHPGEGSMNLDPLSSADVKRKAYELGAQLVGIASAASLADEAHPPQEVLKDVRSVIVIARRFLWGAARLGRPDKRSAHYAGEIGISELEECALALAFYLEDHGHPSLILPAASSRSHQEDVQAEGPLSLTHAAVEAGLGTLGLNGMLLTREYGPRVILCGILSAAPLEPDQRITHALCLGESCGRCLLACPGNAVRQWGLDVEACRPHSSPYGYWFLQQHVNRIVNAPDAAARWEIAKSTDSLMIWQSMLRGVGIITGCTRCQDVCPVGQDWDAHLADVLTDIGDATPEKEEALRLMQEKASRGERGAGFEQQKHWIGENV